MERGQAFTASVPCTIAAATLYFNAHLYTALFFAVCALGFVSWGIFRRRPSLPPAAPLAVNAEAHAEAPGGNVNQFPHAQIDRVVINQAPARQLRPVERPQPAPRAVRVPWEDHPNLQPRGTSIRYIDSDEAGELIEMPPQAGGQQPGLQSAIASFWNSPRQGEPVAEADYVRANIRYTSEDGTLLSEVDYAPWLNAEYNFVNLHVGDIQHLVLAGRNYDGHLVAIQDRRRDYQHVADNIVVRPLPENTTFCIAHVHLTGNRGRLTVQRRYEVRMDANGVMTVLDVTP